MGKLYLGDQEISPLIVQEVAKPDVRFGLTLDYFGTVSEDGTLSVPTERFVVDLTGVKIIGYDGLAYKFYRAETIVGVVAPDLVKINEFGLNNAFYQSRIKGEVSLPKLTTIGLSGMLNAFNSNIYITKLLLPNLSEIGQQGAASLASGCTSIVEVDLSSLMKIGTSAMQSAFSKNQELATISFPALYSVETNSFGSANSNYIFSGCSKLLEIHFNKAAQPKIEAMTGYAAKWGATNATIYFDL